MDCVKIENLYRIVKKYIKKCICWRALCVLLCGGKVLLIPQLQTDDPRVQYEYLYYFFIMICLNIMFKALQFSELL